METTLGEPIDAEPAVSIDPNRLDGSVYAKYQGFLAIFRALFNSCWSDHIQCKPIKTLILVTLVDPLTAISTGFSTTTVGCGSHNFVIQHNMSYATLKSDIGPKTSRD